MESIEQELPIELHHANRTSHLVNTSECPDDPNSFYVYHRFVLVVLFGTVVSLIGMSATFFMAFVALFDFILDGSYIVTMSGYLVIKFYELHEWNSVWYSYIVVAFTVGSVSKLASTFCLVAASIDRLKAATHWSFSGFSATQRVLILLTAFSLAAFIRCMSLLEINIKHFPHCPSPSQFALEKRTLYFWPHWLKTFIGLLLPFVVLFVLNVLIVRKLHQRRSEQIRILMLQLAAGSQEIREHNHKVRSAARTLLCIVFAYLLSNLMNMILSVWETFDVDSLRALPLFYMFSSDLTSILSVAGNVVRLPIFLLLDLDIRKACLQVITCGRFETVTSHWSLLTQNGAVEKLVRFNTALGVEIRRPSAAYSTSSSVYATPLNTFRQLSHIRNGPTLRRQESGTSEQYFSLQSLVEER